MRLLPERDTILHEPFLALIRPLGLRAEVKLIETDFHHLSGHAFLAHQHVEGLQDRAHGRRMLLGENCSEMRRTQIRRHEGRADAVDSDGLGLEGGRARPGQAHERMFRCGVLWVRFKGAGGSTD